MASVKKETLTSVKWTSIERAGVEGIRFILGIIMARLLTPADYGILGMIAVFISISRTFVESGFGNALIRKLDRTNVDFSTVFHFNVVIGIIGGVIGGFLLSLLGITWGGLIGQLGTAVIGAIALLGLASLLQGKVKKK